MSDKEDLSLKDYWESFTDGWREGEQKSHKGSYNFDQVPTQEEEAGFEMCQDCQEYIAYRDRDGILRCRVCEKRG